MAGGYDGKTWTRIDAAMREITHQTKKRDADQEPGYSMLANLPHTQEVSGTFHVRPRTGIRPGRWLVIGLTLVCAGMLLTGCNRGPSVTVVWKGGGEGLAKGTSVSQGSTPVGVVVSVSRTGESTVATIRLRADQAGIVRSESAFIQRKSSDSGLTRIEVVPLNQTAPPVVDGARFQGSNSDTDVVLKLAAANWKLTAAFCGICLLFLLLFVAVIKALLRITAMFVSLGVGSAMTILYSSRVEGILLEYGFNQVEPKAAAVALTFLSGVLLASLTWGIVAFRGKE